jgi:hypothetical protein
MGLRTEVVAQFVVTSTEPGRRSGALETAHGPGSAFEAAVLLFQSIVPVAAGGGHQTICSKSYAKPPGSVPMSGRPGLLPVKVWLTNLPPVADGAAI